MTKVKQFLYFLFTFLLSYNSFASSEENERNWRKSLNVSIKDYEPGSLARVNDWVNSTKFFISEKYRDETIQTLMDEDIKTCNILTAQFKLLYLVEGDDKLQIVTYSASEGKIFLSGQKLFKNNLSEVHSKKVISGRDFPLTEGFTSTSRTANGIRCDDIKQRVNSFIKGDKVVKEGGHSEAFLLLTLKNMLPEIFTYCFGRHERRSIKIVGTVLMISSLKDPCQKNCFPMLLKFNEQLPNILQTFPQIPGILLPNDFARIILIGARDFHREADHLTVKTTRDQFNELSPSFNTRIEIDLANPQARVYSARFQDL